MKNKFPVVYYGICSFLSFGRTLLYGSIAMVFSGIVEFFSWAKRCFKNAFIRLSGESLADHAAGLAGHVSPLSHPQFITRKEKTV